MELRQLRAMTKLGMSHSEWYALPMWERETWLGYEVYRERKLNQMLENLRGKKSNSYSEFTIGAVIHLMSQMI